MPAAIAAVKAALGDKVKDVRVASRLTESASVLVAAEGDPGANFERIMKMVDQTTRESKRILELNPEHPIVKNLDAVAKKGDDVRIPALGRAALRSGPARRGRRRGSARLIGGSRRS